MGAKKSNTSFSFLLPHERSVLKISPVLALSLSRITTGKRVQEQLSAQGPSIWNSIDDHIKLSSASMFKKKMQVEYIERY